MRIKNFLKNSYETSILVKILLFPFVGIRRIFVCRSLAKKKVILSQLTSHLADDPLVKVSEFDGVFAIDVRSDLFSRLILSNKYEPEVSQLCWKYLDPEKDVIDIGANIGFFSVLFAKSIKDRKVLSIEPTPNALRRLRRNLDLNNVSEKVVVFEGVVSDVNGLVNLGTIEGKEEYSSLGAMDHPAINNNNKIQIETVSRTLDQLVSDNMIEPGFIKIDVEGAENLVLKGAVETLQRNRPIIVSELYDFLLKRNGTSAQQVISKLESLDYSVIDPFNKGRTPGSLKFGDILCIPKERM